MRSLHAAAAALVSLALSILSWRLASWCVARADGKRSPAGFVVPAFIEEADMEQYLFDLFHESATPGNGDVRRMP